MRVVVTGVAGFIGSHLAEQLLAEGHLVVGVDAFIDSYPRKRKLDNMAALSTTPGFEFHELDLRTDPLEPLVAGAEVVINEAAMAGMTRSWDEFALYSGCNLLAVDRLIQAATREGVRRFVQVSTSSVYGLDAVGDEQTATRPISPYGVSKLAAEHLLLAHEATFGFPAVILRYFSVYGPRQRPDMAYAGFIDQIRRGEPITVFGDGMQTRSNTYVSDIVRGTIQGMDGARQGEIYNLSGSHPITLLDAIRIIGEALGVEPEVLTRPTRKGDQRHTAGDSNKARADFGYVPGVVPDEGLRRQVSWQIERPA